MWQNYHVPHLAPVVQSDQGEGAKVASTHFSAQILAAIWIICKLGVGGEEIESNYESTLRYV